MSALNKLLSGLLLATGIALTLPGRADLPAKEDAFLDQPLPAGLKFEQIPNFPPDGKVSNGEFLDLKITSYQDGVALLGKITGKKILLPDGLAEWLKEHPDSN